MARPVCDICHRPLKVCLCDWIEPVNNRIEIGILQHPDEVHQVKGTARIAELSLQRCRLWIGESFASESTLHDWLAEGEIFLLYPPTEHEVSRPPVFASSEVRSAYSPERLKVLVIDGTWRKTYKMMMSNAFLGQLRRIHLEPEQFSNYRIRKQKSASSLSTVEAIYQLLVELEGEGLRARPLISAFEKMVEQQLAFRTQRGED